MNDYIKLFVEKINSTDTMDELIKVDCFPVDYEHTGYLYAYKTERGIHIDAGVSIGDCNSFSPETRYYGHTLHDYYSNNAYPNLENLVSQLFSKTMAQLDILAPINRQLIKRGESPIL